jgi:formylglycine-generating enzyme required for sulfatase activity
MASLIMLRYYLILLAVPAFFFAGCSTSQQTDVTASPAATQHPPAVNSPLIKDMAYIPAGDFLMGADDADALPDEKPVHRVFLKAYYIDRYEVTNAQYQRFVLATGRPAPFVDRPWAEPYNWQGTAYPAGKGNAPVVLVSWEDAHAYAQWAGKRLPTEAEWEKAARGKLSGMKYPGGNTLDMNQANFDKGFMRERAMHPVGTYEPNSVGLYDMSGNVWEWCQDWYADDFYKKAPGQDPQGPAEGVYRVTRGGSWVNDKNVLRCSQRGKSAPESLSHTVGFRCALSADAAKSSP